MARRALEEVCARGDFARAPELYSPDFLDHVNTEDWTVSDDLSLLRQLGVRPMR